MEVEVFRNSIMKCDAILKQHGVRLYDLLMSEDEDLMKDVVTSFVCITSIQVLDISSECIKEADIVLMMQPKYEYVFAHYIYNPK